VFSAMLMFIVGLYLWTSHHDIDRYSRMRTCFAIGTIVLSVPLLCYEVAIATQGRPVVISGNCMLVELDPRLGFLDSEIDNWWKVLVGLNGL